MSRTLPAPLRAALHVGITLTLLLAITTPVLTLGRAHGDDLVQDYVSARAWLDGESPYRTLNELRERIGFEPVPGHVMVRHNPHPPGAVLLTAPYARLEFGDALTWVRWSQLAALAVAWALAYRLFAPPVPGVVWAAAGGLFGLWAPFWQGLDWGQPVGLLALATAGLWALARAPRPVLFGLLLGFACTVRPFFAIHAVVAAGWSRRDGAKATFAAVAGGLLPFALTGISPLTWLRLSSDASAYVAESGSIPGMFGLGTAGGVALYAAAALALGCLRWRGLGTDATVALAAVAAMLAYPLAWFQYDVSLIPVVGWLAVAAHRSDDRPARLGLVVYLVLRTLPDVIPDPQGTGWADVLGRWKGWLQLGARTVLLLAVGSAARRLSASGPA